MSGMRLFELHRREDVSGISGIGVVAQGVVFADGTCCMRWMTEHRSTVLYDSIDHVELIHGHSGTTSVVFVDS